MSERCRLLIVDDTPENILLLTETLKDSYQIQAANNGQRALQIAQRQPPPDLILLDVMMPEMDGYEVCSALKGLPQCANIPVIFVTALNTAGDEEKGLALGAVDYITKPINPSLVRARVRNHLELKRHRDFLEQEVQARTQELLQATLARELLENDLKLALKLQTSMLPPSRQANQQNLPYRLSACLRPARTIGGDLYDYIRLEGQRLLVAVGDVSDKGVAAALFMVRVLTLLRWMAPSAQDPARLLGDLNAALCQDNDACMFVTLGLAVVDLQTGQVQYASGGHEPPVLLSPDRCPQLLELSGGPALGLFEAQFGLHHFSLSPGQALMLLSDGVAEANNHHQEEFGFDRLLALQPERAPTDPAVVLERTLEGIDRFTAGADPSDDLTVLILQYAPALDGLHIGWELANNLAALQEFSQSLRQRLAPWEWAGSLVDDLDLILEELLVNIIKYGYDQDQEDQIELEFRADQEGNFRLIIRDRGRPFNPLEAEERPEDKVGGWGIPLIRNLTDRVDYHLDQGVNQITLWRGQRETWPA